MGEVSLQHYYTKNKSKACELEPFQRWELPNWLCNVQQNHKYILSNIYMRKDSPIAAGDKTSKRPMRNNPSLLHMSLLCLYFKLPLPSIFQ